MIRRPPRSTLDRSSAASDVYKRQVPGRLRGPPDGPPAHGASVVAGQGGRLGERPRGRPGVQAAQLDDTSVPVSYTHLRAHETVLDLVCRLLLEKKKNKNT